MLIMLFTFLFFFLLGYIGFSIIYWTLTNGISPMPSSKKIAVQLLSALPSSVPGPIYELGAGWGTLAFPLARKYPQNQIYAYENSLIPYLFCRVRLMLFPLANLHLIYADFYKSPLNDASVVVCYLFPGAMQKLKQKVDEELQTNTLIISNTFGMPGLKPINTIEIDDLYHTKIYIYNFISTFDNNQ